MMEPYNPPAASGSSTPQFDNQGSGMAMIGNDEGFRPNSGQVRRGVCKFFNSQKGFGFVLDNKSEELGGQEVFVHFTSIQSKTGFRSLAEGEEVEYEVVTGPKGFQAANLTGPGGRPVMGDPKSGEQRKGPHFMQYGAPIAMGPGGYAMDPYGQQLPGAMYAPSPYQAHVVFGHHPNQFLPPQQGQYSQMMQPGSGGPSPVTQFSPQMGAYQNQRQAGISQQQQQQQGFGSPSGSFGPVGGMASTAIGGYQAQNAFGSPQQGLGNGRGGYPHPPLPPQQQQQQQQQSIGGFGFGSGSGLGLAAQQGGRDEMGGDSFNFAASQGQQQQSQQDQSLQNSGNGAPNNNNFFSSGNLLYSSN